VIVGDGPARPEMLRLAAAAGLPAFTAALRPDPQAVAALAGRRALAFAGIGDPDKFFATLDAAGIEIAVRKSFADHHRFTPAEAQRLLQEARERGLFPVTTEKDVVRLA